jgi:DNA-binding NarL/FixJ family response regulator
MTTTPNATDRIASQTVLPPPGVMNQPRFSPRESQIVVLITTGCSNREIAARMGLRTQTVKNHLCRIYRKLGVPNRVQLAVFAVCHGTGDVSS